MNVGLPTTGLGGIFYILIALAMPLVEGFRYMQNKGSRSGLVLAIKQFSITILVLAAIWATGLLLNIVLPNRAQVLGPSAYGADGYNHNFISLVFVSPFATL